MITQNKLTTFGLKLGLFTIINVFGLMLIIYPKLYSLINITANNIDHISNTATLLLVGAFTAILILIAWIHRFIDPSLGNTAYVSSMIACFIALFGGFYADVYFLVTVAKLQNNYSLVFDGLSLYFSQNFEYYISLLLLMALLSVIYKNIYGVNFEKTNDRLIQIFFVLMALLLPIIILAPIPLINLYLFKYFNNGDYFATPLVISYSQNVLYGIFNILLFVVAYKIRRKTKPQINFLLKLANAMGAISGFAVLFEILMLIYPYKLLASQGKIEPKMMLSYAGSDIKANVLTLAILLVITLILVIIRTWVKKLQFNDINNEDNAGDDYGGAQWANSKDLLDYGYYIAQNHLYSGLDEKGERLYLPIKNRTVLAPAGGGKTSTVAIPLLLQYNGPIFSLDIKTELWTVAARHRFEKFRRRQIAIDPFNQIAKPALQYKADFTKKPIEILTKFRINPFYEIPDEPDLRQRVLTSFSKSFIVREGDGNSSAHFYNNCESLVGGLIDYILKTQDKENQTFTTMLDLVQTPKDDINPMLEHMLEMGGQSQFAASTLLGVGAEEYGSIFSTTKMQLQWLVDINIQDLMKTSDFSIKEFIDDKCDIYLILPTYAVKSHGRLFRMVLSLICSMINQHDDQLCGKKYIFLCDEMAQIGKSTELEQLVEVYRTYDVVLCSIFQSTSQIEEFDKPDVFKDPGTGGILQFFKTKNPESMKWIQEVFGKRTLLQKTLSMNKGDSKQKSQVFGGSTSKGEGESVHSAGTDFVQIDEIREMPKDEQWFLIDDKPIKSKKVPYYLDPFFSGTFDPNPFEDKNFAQEIKKRLDEKSIEAPTRYIDDQKPVPEATPEAKAESNTAATTTATVAVATLVAEALENMEQTPPEQATHPVSNTTNNEPPDEDLPSETLPTPDEPIGDEFNPSFLDNEIIEEIDQQNFIYEEMEL